MQKQRSKERLNKKLNKKNLSIKVPNIIDSFEIKSPNEEKNIFHLMLIIKVIENHLILIIL